MNERSIKAAKSVQRSLKNLNKQMKILQEEYPEANYFMACETFHMLTKPQEILRDNYLDINDHQVACEILGSADCGDW